MSKEKQIEHEYKCQSCFHAGVCPEYHPKTYSCMHHVDKADVAPRAEWISVDERLPGVTGRYICAVKDKNGHTWTVAGDYSLEMKTWFGLMFGEIKNTVTHWMPLPEPPKGDHHE